MNFSPRNQMAARRAAQRKRPDRIISILLILSLLFGNLAGFPSAAAELTSYCGKEGQVHTEECYKVAVTTEPTETEGGEETTSETTEAMEETEAAQTVIISDTPVCGKEEHTHTLKCYSNPDADVETAANWEATLPETLTGTWADDLLATVRSQVGYKESVENFIVEADGETTSGYNRYGAWYGSYTQDENQPYLPWNITFLFFSIYYSNIDDFPLEETCPDWIDSLDYYGLYRAAGEYTPAEGDLVFVDTDGDGEADRVGVVSEVKDAAQGLVNNALVNDSLMSVKKSDGTAALPMFNAAFINGTNSLNKKLGDVYENVSFPFTKKDVNNNGVEYWYFDSAETTLEMKKDSTSDDYFLKAHSSLQSWAKNVDSSSIDQGTYGFFPFNSGSTSCVANSYNYGFGCRLDIPFRLTSDGKVSDKNGNKVDIVFEFSGDDDVWVFIDGQLALDIGGAHGKVTGNLNFATKQAYVDNAKINPGTNNTGSNGSKTTSFSLVGANTAEHVLTMFYMERGMWESNMKITFNFPDENQLEVEKQVDTTEVNSLFTSDEVGEDVFSDQKLFTFNIQNLATHFEDVAAKGASYDSIPWNVADSALACNASNTFNRGTYHEKYPALYWNAQYDDTSSQYRHKRYGVVSLQSAVNITNMSKLSFYITPPL